MEYFLPLSVLAMIISSISIYAIDYHQPKSTTDPENDQSSSDPSDSTSSSAEEYTVSENSENLQKSVAADDKLSNDTLKKLHSTRANLKVIFKSFSMLWNTTLNTTFSANRH